MSIFIIAEAGINHNGDIEIAKKLIDAAASSGADAIKFQKRTLDVVYTKELLDSPRESPWGTTQRQQKAGLEFGLEAFQEIDRHCKQVGIEWFASAWDVEAQRFLQQFDFRHNKVASAMLTHEPYLNMVAEEKKPTFISTGMSTLEEIEHVVQLFRKKDCPFELMHCNATYPMAETDANLRVITTLKKLFSCPVGYSGHEVGLTISVAAAALGATSIERHLTLDRAMYGSDQAASVEVVGFVRLVRMIRAVEAAMGDGVKRLGDKERAVRAKLAPWSLDPTLDHPNNPFRVAS
ncbi:MAG: N-acetylneuraminate synthase family protein [Magnetococcales bacterium]|nr:N-acetylneuraminate synthase family protein [Magnetococcales bacterium]